MKFRFPLRSAPATPLVQFDRSVALGEPRKAISTGRALRLCGEPATHAAPLSQARIRAIRAEEQARITAVFSSPECHGRERAAAGMIATSMTAAEIIATLPAMTSQTVDPMVAALTSTRNPDISTGGGHARRGGGHG